jgi:hypothetical protein
MVYHYHIDTEGYSLTRFQRGIASRQLIPSRRCLQDELEERFRILKDAGISNLKELIDALKTKAKVEQFSQMTGLPNDYLTILRREANSYLPKPVRLDILPGVAADHVARLKDEGITNTQHLFNQAGDRQRRVQLAQRTGIPPDKVDELVGLSDLTRAYGVGPVFARIIYDVGIRSIKDFVEQTAEDFIRLYEEQAGKKADFSVGEIQFSLDLAKELDIAVDM